MGPLLGTRTEFTECSRTVRYTDIPKISVLNQYRYIDTGYSAIPIYRNFRYTEISDIPEFFGIPCYIYQLYGKTITFILLLNGNSKNFLLK